MLALERIESLKNEGKSPDEIESLLLNEELGKIRPDKEGYQYIGNIRLSWLIVEVHKSGFIECMHMHTKEYVVHHKDGNILNNIYSNLQVMKWGNHTKLHCNDPKFAETERIRNKKHSKWWNDPVNTEAIKARNEATSRSLIAYNTDPANTKAIKVGRKNYSKTKRKNWPDLTTFKKPFTVGDYADVGGVSVDTAWDRLKRLLTEGQITCEKMLVNRKWNNVYRRKF